MVQVHQKMSAARYQARRTARSAYNNNKAPQGFTRLTGVNKIEPTKEREHKVKCSNHKNMTNIQKQNVDQTKQTQNVEQTKQTQNVYQTHRNLRLKNKRRCGTIER